MLKKDNCIKRKTSPPKVKKEKPVCDSEQICFTVSDFVKINYFFPKISHPSFFYVKKFRKFAEVDVDISGKTVKGVVLDLSEKAVYVQYANDKNM